MLRLLQDVMQHSSVLATDVPVTLRDGRQRIIHVEAEPEFNEHGHGVGYTGIVQDVTDRRLAEDRIRHLANFDALTGLPNRRQLIWRAERALEHARRLGHQCALLLIDLDRFKIINDTLGHAAGDELLMEVARRLRSCVRHCDQVMEGALEAVGSRSHRTLEAVGRLGGDEFVALLPEVGDERDAERVAERILEVDARADLRRRAGVLRHRQRRHRDLPARRRLGGRPDAQLRRGDVLGQVAGQERLGDLQPAAGRPRAREARARKRAAQGDRARRTGAALPAEDRRARGAHGRRRGADALAARRRAGAAGRLHSAGRGNRPDRAAVRMGAARGGAPGAHLAGQLRLRRLDRRQPAEPAVRAHRPGRAHPPARTTTYGVPHRAIQLEITETGLMKDLQNVIPSLHRLNEIGVEISIDDFGTGYSSLAYLTTLPISELKIDRSFVRDLGITPQSSAVVTAIIALARSLGLRVIAEGVENLRQMEVLHRLGCGLMQGFLFSRAAPARGPRALARADRAAAQGAVDRPGRRTPAGWRAVACRRRSPVLTGKGRSAMDMSHGASQLAAAALSPVQLAKAALRRLALAKLEPTPENYARAYAAEGGHVASGLPERARPLLQRLVAPLGEAGFDADALLQALMAGHWDEAGSAIDEAAASAGEHAQDWADLLRRLAHGLERGSRLWTAARKKDSLPRVLTGSRSDAQRLRERLRQLLAAWEAETDEPGVDSCRVHSTTVPSARRRPVSWTMRRRPCRRCPPLRTSRRATGTPLVQSLEGTVRAALPEGEARAGELAHGLLQLSQRVAEAGATPELARRADELCQRARRMLAHRHHLVDELGKLCVELTQGPDRTGRGRQLGARPVRGDAGAPGRRPERAQRARRQRAAGQRARAPGGAARRAQSGARRAEGTDPGHAQRARRTRRADRPFPRQRRPPCRGDREGRLAREPGRRGARDAARQRRGAARWSARRRSACRSEQARAGEMQARARARRRTAPPVRRSLHRRADAGRQPARPGAGLRGRARAHCSARAPTPRPALAVGLLDIDNFKKLNDKLGHCRRRRGAEVAGGAGARAAAPAATPWRASAARSSWCCCPTPSPAEAQQMLTRLQRPLTASLFMHDNKEVFVTFSAGVTALREAEALEVALERADEALYEAKRTGKNRTCIG